jgi:acetolactate synthase-1/2/3 large subunit
MHRYSTGKPVIELAKMSGYHAVVDAVKEKAKYSFGIPEHPRIIYDQIHDTPEIQSVLVRHECSGVLMAMAYARVFGKTAPCFGSPGRGVANLVPGFLEAYYACTPLVAPCPTVTLENERNFWEM